MNTRNQLIVSAVAVSLAVAGVVAYSQRSSTETAEVASAGHVHAAPAAGTDGARGVRLDVESARRIGVTYATATMKPISRTVRTVGSITYDETRVASVSPRVEGWVERLYVDFTGAPVSRGQPLMQVYSPMLVSAQEELLLASRLVAEASAAGSERSLASAEDLLAAARRRFQYWDVSAEEVARIERTGTPQRALTLSSPAGGVVVEKDVVVGSRVMPGMELYRIADLSRVWIEGEIFEKDLSLVHLGQRARVTLEAYPGEVFEAVVTYVYPTMSLESRTGRVRLELPNPGLRLKPGMYAQVELESGDDRPALLVPRSAVHHTGTRALVFARHGDTLMPHEVVTGLVSGNEIEILRGLDAGMEVVSSANFLVDAESNMASSLGSMSGVDSTASMHVGH